MPGERNGSPSGPGNGDATELTANSGDEDNLNLFRVSSKTSTKPEPTEGAMLPLSPKSGAVKRPVAVMGDDELGGAEPLLWRSRCSLMGYLRLAVLQAGGFPGCVGVPA